MTKTTHTHRGTCQACGRVHAVDNVSGLVAKHGYTVDYGYFNGVCTGGEGFKPAEHDVKLTNRVIESCAIRAAERDSWIAELKDGRTIPATFERWNPMKKVEHTAKGGHTYTVTGCNDVLPIAKATKEERAKAIALAIHNHEMHASGLRAHAHRLTVNVLVRLGKPLYVAAELDAPKVKEAAPVVDVATATVTGTYKTKAARKEALDKLNRAFEKARNELQNLYLTLSHAERTEAKTEVYYGPMQLNHWRPKHSMQALNEFPGAASIVERIEALIKAREAVKAAP